MEVEKLSILAHELKTPLVVIRQLALTLDLATNELQKQQLQSDLVSVSERALRQITDLSRLSHLNYELFPLEPLSIRAICNDVLRDLRPLQSAQHRFIQPSYKNRRPLVIANQQLLYSMIYNFCANAVYYSEDHSTARLSLSEHQEHMKIQIRDFGPALPSSIWKLLKSHNLKAPLNIPMRPGSSGLGLFIASIFATHLGTEINVIRHRDGTSFYFYLPLSKQASFDL